MPGEINPGFTRVNPGLSSLAPSGHVTKCLGMRPSKEPPRRVRYDRAQLIPEVFLVEMCAVFLKEKHRASPRLCYGF
jgi:hypothetical protein